MKFTELKLHSDLLAAIHTLKLETLTEIQQGVFKPAMAGKDIAGAAQTGTGKTIAFLMPILNRIFSEQPQAPSALVLTPTRELCIQISEEATKLSSKHQLGICSLYGGQSYRIQEAQLAKNPHLIVATPGRLIDFMKQGHFSTDSLRTLVLDEADRMFDMGFVHDIRFIMRSLPKNVQTMLFSATLPYKVMRLAKDYMQNMVEVRIKAKTVAADRIEQSIVHLGASEKNAYLVNQLHAAQKHEQTKEQKIKALVFTNFRYKVTVLTNVLRKYGINAIGISSLLNQNSRVRLLNGFKSGQHSILVATDVASRGIDIDQLDYVFNYDLPQDPEAYVHRIGRTARAGLSGISISYCCEADYTHLPHIERCLGQKIPRGNVNTDFLEFPKNGFEPLPPLGQSEAKSETKKDTQLNLSKQKRGSNRQGVKKNNQSANANKSQKKNRPHSPDARRQPRGSRPHPKHERKSKAEGSKLPVQSGSLSAQSQKSLKKKGNVIGRIFSLFK